MSEWKPIESAPKDGAKLDFFCVRTHCHGSVDNIRKTDVSWGPIANSLTGDIYEGWRGLSELHAEVVPTHWMPVPEPPEGE